MTDNDNSNDSRIYIDDRKGSDNLIKIFPQDLVEVCRLDAADIMFFGAGVDNSTASIGIEHKTCDDILKCICDGRFAGDQLIKMCAEYDEVWLLIEDDTRIGIDGALQIASHGKWYNAHAGSRYFTWDQYETWIATMVNKTPLKVKQLRDRRETKHWIMMLYHWWQKGYDHHHSDHVQSKAGRPVLIKASPLREFAATLPGIGWLKAGAVEGYFNNIREAVEADVNQWAQVDGIGRKMAIRIKEAINNGRQKEAEARAARKG